MTDAVEKVADDLRDRFHLTFLGSGFVSVFVSFSVGTTDMGAGVQLSQVGSTDAQATHVAGMFSHGRQIWLQGSSSSARWRRGGTHRERRKGRATAYARSRGVSSGAQSASLPSCARYGIWRTPVYPSRRALHPVRPHARRAGSFERSH